MCQYSAERGEANGMAHDPSRHARALGRRHAVHRGDRRRAGRPHHARRPRPLGRRHRSRAQAGARRDPQAFADRRDDAACARGPQGVEPRAVGRRAVDPGVAKADGCRTRRRRSAQGRRRAAARARHRRPDPRARSVRRVGEARGAARHRRPRTACARTAICCISSSRRSPTSAPTNTAARSKTACAFRSKSSMPCAPYFRPTNRSACACRRRTGSTAAGESRTPSRSRDELKKRGCDWIDVSSGGVSPLQKIPLEPGYQVPFAKAVKQATGLPTIAVGLITDPTARRGNHRERRGRFHRAGARDALQPALAVACGGATGRDRRSAAAILALATARTEGAVRRHFVRTTLTAAAVNPRVSPRASDG